jgi:hypothetical protein
VVNIFENQDGHWVVRFNLETVDSEQGLTTYMNVFIRCNALVTKYGLQRVRACLVHMRETQRVCLTRSLTLSLGLPLALLASPGSSMNQCHKEARLCA